jgi:hypothetical protein
MLRHIIPSSINSNPGHLRETSSFFALISRCWVNLFPKLAEIWQETTNINKPYAFLYTDLQITLFFCDTMPFQRLLSNTYL